MQTEPALTLLQKALVSSRKNTPKIDGSDQEFQQLAIAFLDGTVTQGQVAKALNCPSGSVIARVFPALRRAMLSGRLIVAKGVRNDI